MHTHTQTVIANEVGDTVVADPLLNVHLLLPSAHPLSKASLCYELRGMADKYFNLLSNNCTSINAHYATVPGHPDINIIDEVSVRTTDLANRCIDVSINLQCTTVVNSTPLGPNQEYASNGVTVGKYGGASVQVAIPSCSGGQSLALRVECQSGTLRDVDAIPFIARMMKIVVRRSLVTTGGSSHGLLGMFIFTYCSGSIYLFDSASVVILGA